MNRFKTFCIAYYSLIALFFASIFLIGATTDNSVIQDNYYVAGVKETDYYGMLDDWMIRLSKKYEITDYRLYYTIIKYANQYSDKYGIDFRHIVALIGVESEFKPKAVSYLGEKYGNGLMQVSKVVLTEFNWNNNSQFEVSDLYDIETNIAIGCWYYARLRDHYRLSNNYKTLMSAYNRGYKGGYATNYVAKIEHNLQL